MKILNSIDRFGTVGLFLTAILSPCCFPIFAFGASALGLGSFELFGGWTMWIFEGMALVSLVGLYLSYRKHFSIYPLLIAVPSVALIFYGYHFNESDYWQYFLYAGMIGLLTATGVNYYRNKLHNTCTTCIPAATANVQGVELNSTITCPNCGHQKNEIMPTDTCLFFYVCDNCKTRLKPKEGDCCVFCSYGTKKCPPMQVGSSCC